MTAVLFGSTALLWGTSAIVTALQAGIVPAPVSVAYRMILVCGCMLVLGAVRSAPLRLERHDLPWVALQGVLFFGLAFIAFYHATRLIPSGVAALILSTSSVLAALLGRAVLNAPLAPQALAGLACGIAGLGIICAPDIAKLADGDNDAVAGALWAALSAFSTAAGTVIGARNQQRKVPLVAVMAWGALTGATFAIGWSLIEGAEFVVDTSTRYLAGLAYLAVAASCIAFLMYFDLVRRIGPARAAYTLAVVPVVALALSAAFEGMALDGRLLLGSATILAGNILVLSG